MGISLIISVCVTLGFFVWQRVAYNKNKLAANNMLHFFSTDKTSDYRLIENQEGQKLISCNSVNNQTNDSTSLLKLVEELN